MKFRSRTVLMIAAALVIAALSSAATAAILGARQINSENARALGEIIGSIEQKYYGTAPDGGALVKAAASGMLDALGDPYAAYFTDEEYGRYLEQFNGEYVGIGAQVGQVDEKGSKVLEVYENGPASAAGIKAGDVIIGVNGKSVAGLSLGDLSKLLSGPEGTHIALKVQRGGETLDFELRLAKINMRRVHSALLAERTGYIRIDMFSGNCTAEFNEAIKSLTEQNMRSLVIDLRNDPGGGLLTVVDVADAILTGGTIVTVKEATGQEEVYRAKEGGVSVPLAVLVNEHSASASEILAAAIKDNNAGTIVGMKTYGKGVVQTTFQLHANRAWLKLTTAAYYTPSGANIDKLGVEPDIRVDLAPQFKTTPIAQLKQEDDAQLLAALSALSAQTGALGGG